MAKKPSDPELRRLFGEQLREKLRGTPYSKAAALLGVTPQSIYLYTKGKVLPRADIFEKAVEIWGLEFPYRGMVIAASGRPKAPRGAGPQQMSLFNAIAAIRKGDMEVNIAKKSSSALTLEIELKFG